jgi:hypothetical protein
MRIILHIGAWKTGSSAIQQFMAVSTEALRAHGVAAPADAINADGRGRILNKLTGSDEEAAEVTAEIEQLRAEGVETLVLSNEHYWPMSEVKIQTIGARLKALADTVEVLIYVRPQEKMWRSLHSQQAKKFHVKSGAALWGTADFLPPVFAQRAVHYHQTLQLFANVFGQDAISVRLYDRACFVGRDVVADFLAYLGLDWMLFERQNRDINRSVGWKGVAFAVWVADEVHDAMRALNPDKLVGKVYIRTIKRTADIFSDEDWIGRDADPLTTEDKKAIRAHYEEDNQRLYQTYFLGEDVFGAPDEGRGDSVDPSAIPNREMVVAKRRFQKLAERKEYDITGLETLFAPPRPRPTALKRLLNALPFRAQKS